MFLLFFVILFLIISNAVIIKVLAKRGSYLITFTLAGLNNLPAIL